MYNESADDLSRKYGNSYVLWNGEVQYCSEFRYNNKDVIVVIFSDIEEQVYDPRALSVPSVEFGFFNYSKAPTGFPKCWSHSRRPKRQWHRGICDANTHLESPWERMLNLLGKQNIALRVDKVVVNNMVTPVFPKIAEALEELERVKCVAISTQYAVCLHPQHATRALLTTPFSFIGEVVSPREWIVKHHVMLQEIVDFSNRNNLGIDVYAG